VCIFLRQEEGEPLPGEEIFQTRQNRNERVGGTLQIQNYALKTAIGTLAEQFSGKQTGISLGEAGTIPHRHDAAAEMLGALQAEKTQIGTDAIGQMGRAAVVVPQMVKLGGGSKDEENVL
jgi:hypothetical protein